MKSDNELIAEFMGYYINRESHNAPVIYYPDGDYSYISDVGFELYWDRLMPVVEKIEEDLLLQVEIHTAYTNINGELDGAQYNQDSCFEAQSDTKLTVTYNAVVQFIKWYNNQKK